ncbi:hypothetical protein MMC24_005545, partial [Lignoscripta atroalba]|nr:hypothetical protein [Lignoscripta atroalba]
MVSFSNVAWLRAALAILPFTKAIPIDASHLEVRGDCNNIGTTQDPLCWTALNMTAYLNEWITTSGKECYDEFKDFAYCYLSVVMPATFADCSTMNMQSCDYNIVNGSKTPQEVHTLYHIYRINNFFNQYNAAIISAAGLSLGRIPAIVSNIDTPKSSLLDLSNILTVLSAGLSLIPGPAGIAASTLTKSAQAAISVIVGGIGQIPGLTRVLFPTGTTDSKIVQAAELSSQLSTLTSQLIARFDEALKLAETDYTTFLALAQTGAFYGPTWDFSQLTTSMALALDSYVISTCLEGNDIHGVVGVATNPQALSTNASAANLAYDIKCPNYDEYGVCNAWYYSNNTQSAYTLNNFDARQINYYSNYQLWFGEGWTTGEALFVNAAECMQSGRFGQAPSVDFTVGKVNLHCISQLRMYTWDMSCKYEARTRCEFTDGEAQGGYGQWDNKGGWNNAWSSGGGYERLLVPAGYLGPWIVAGEGKITN